MIIPVDPWTHLRRHTAARIALGRTGGSLPTRELLAFNADHAAARDAVHAPFAIEPLTAELRSLSPDLLVLESAAPGRASYLQRPDLGRRLSESSRAQLSALDPQLASPSSDLVIIVSDGLSALAAETQASPLLRALWPKLQDAGWRLAPLCLVRHARVALLDEIGAAFRASLALILLGERPGLGSADSLGAYFEFLPQPGRTDAERNCVSNIRPAGLPPAAAAEKLFALLTDARAQRISGVGLKENPAPPKPELR